MNRKICIAILIVLVALVVGVSYLNASQQVEDHSEKTVTFNVSAGTNSLNESIKSIKTLPYYEGYDNKTVEWMESLGDERVYYGNGTIVVMNTDEAEKIQLEPAITDVYIYNIFTADVIENHTLGENQQMVYHVENVTFIKQDIVSNGLA